MRDRPYYLSPPEMYALRRAVEPINEAFDNSAYLVGSVLHKPDFRDVDVRAILDDDHFCRLFGRDLDQVHGRATALWTVLSTTISRDLAHQTGLRIDFQFQARSIANGGGYEGERQALMLPTHVEPVVAKIAPPRDKETEPMTRATAAEKASSVMAYRLRAMTSSVSSPTVRDLMNEAANVIDILTHLSTPTRPMPPDLVPGLRRALWIVDSGLAVRGHDEYVGLDARAEIEEVLRAELAAQAERGTGEERGHG